MSKNFPTCRSVLPHGENIVLLNRVELATDDTVICSATVGEPLVSGFDKNPVSPLILLEYMAQAVAMFPSSVGTSTNTEKKRVGFIASVKDFCILEQWLSLGQKLSVRARSEFLSDNAAVFHGSVFDTSSQTELCHARMSLVTGERNIESNTV